SYPGYKIEQIKFSDGVTWDQAAIMARVITNGTAGNDGITGYNDGTNRIYGLDGSDNLTGGALNDLIDGGTGTDTLNGNTGDDTLFGQDGTDTLNGGAGADTLVGGVGNDALNGDAGNDTYLFATGAGVDRITDYDTTAGNTDVVQFSNVASTALTALERQGNDLVLKYGTADQVSVSEFFYSSYPGYKIEQIKFSDGVTWGLADVLLGSISADTLVGGSGDGVLMGYAGNDALSGNGGNDLLDGGLGADTLVGGVGNDIYVVDDLGDSVSETSTLATEIDTVQSSITYTLGANLESLTLTGTAAVNGTGNALNNMLTGNGAANVLSGGAGADTLTGSAGNDSLIGGAGNDRLDGGVDIDSMAGGAGDDVYVVDNAGDVVTENLNEGYWDTVESSISYTLGANVEALTLTGTAAINGTGNTLDNTLTGNSGNNVLTGGAGYDTLDGGVGADTMVGGTEDDYYVVDNAGDIVTENANEGDDSIELYLAADYILGTNVEGIYRYGTGNWKTTGNALNNYLYGNSGKDTLIGLGGNDILWGGSGIDTMQGGTGDDTYYVDNASDIVTENANEGTDTVYVWSTVAHTLAANVENGVRMFNAGSLTGNSLNNTLTGAYGNDTLVGGAGNDRLIGGAGTDTLQGGTGDDTYVVDVATDIVTENLNEGYWDTVESSISYTLGANVEALNLTGTAAINGTGNALDNTLTGNSASNVLTGGAGNDSLDGGVGADTMIGGVGDDYYVIDNAGDIVTENAGEGTDTVEFYQAADYTLAANIEYAYRYSTGSWKTTGNASNNYLYGNEGNDTLIGLGGNDILYGDAGADTLIGGVGDDTYYIESAGDVVTESANEGTDAVYVFSSAAHTLAANVENGSRSFWAGSLTGNSLNNTLTGSWGNDTLIGDAGDDRLTGLGGVDTLTGGIGNDTYVLGRGYSADTVVENDATAGNTDIAQFLTGVAADQIWFQHVGNNLEASIIGTSDKLVVKDWYLGSANHVEQFKTTDGAKTLLDSNVANLVNAMASFAPPAAGQTSLPTNYQTALAPVIAANWQ
ncbi:calcium-binding protein, partial [Thiobacillus sp.]|uniref:beta strand repeat-containing protein n=1 Tax=Thiobacillus sp. TaxID=924 RepID=UPI0025FBF7E5